MEKALTTFVLTGRSLYFAAMDIASPKSLRARAAMRFLRQISRSFAPMEFKIGVESSSVVENDVNNAN